MKGTTRRKTTTTAPSVLRTVDPASLHDKISKKAYELFEKRGYQHGHHKEDWLEAERIVYSQLEPVSELGPRASTQRSARTVSGRRHMPQR